MENLTMRKHNQIYLSTGRIDRTQLQATAWAWWREKR